LKKLKKLKKLIKFKILKSIDKKLKIKNLNNNMIKVNKLIKF